MIDAQDQLETWQAVMAPQAQPLLRAIQQSSRVSPAVVRRLRREWSADLVRIAIELTAAREKAVTKFPNAPTLVADVAGVEQASSQLVAVHKAARFARAAPTRIHDLCCGIGGDAMSLIGVAPVVGIDHNPVRAWMAGRNAGCEIVTAEVESVSLSGAVFHLDPSRRDDTGHRHWRYEDYCPGPAFVDHLLREGSDGAIKLGPGVQFDDLPDLGQHEIEIINEHGTLTQVILWSGRLAFHAGLRSATRLPDGVTFTGAPCPIPHAGLDCWIHSVDPAIERGGLLGTLAESLGLGAPHPQSGLLTAREPIQSPWLTPYELVADLPWRERTVRIWLRDHHAGDLVIRTRGRAVNPDIVQSRLRGSGRTPFTIFIQRFDEKVRALVCRPITDQDVA